MRFFTWNVRGMNAPNKHRFVKYQIIVSQEKICMLQETKLDSEGVVTFGKRMGSWKVHVVEIVGAEGSLLTLWCPNMVSLDRVVVGNKWLA